MSPHDLYLEARRRGLELDVRGEKLSVTPRHRCPPDFAQVLLENKAALIQWFQRDSYPRRQEVPPNDLQLHPVQPRPAAAGARLIMDYVVRQIGDTPGPLCEWCLRREMEYWAAYHWPDHVCAYASARDAACWQLRQSEQDVWWLLEGETTPPPQVIGEGPDGEPVFESGPSWQQAWADMSIDQKVAWAQHWWTRHCPALPQEELDRRTEEYRQTLSRRPNQDKTRE
jgi:hypothetical protein